MAHVFFDMAQCRDDRVHALTGEVMEGASSDDPHHRLLDLCLVGRLICEVFRQESFGFRH
jgi:hypothetical protein